MSYVKPTDVDSPRLHWRLLDVLYDAGAGEWSAARGQWDSEGEWKEVLAIRWNGNDTADTAEIGNPQSRGRPTWFIVPDKLKDSVRKAIDKLVKEGD